MNVASPCAGRVEKLLVKLNESYPVGAVLGYLEASKEDADAPGLGSAVHRRTGKETETASMDQRCEGQQEAVASNRRCAACLCRRTPPARATCRRA